MFVSFPYLTGIDTGAYVHMAPLSSLATGYRHVFLSRRIGNVMLPPPSLFVHIGVSLTAMVCSSRDMNSSSPIRFGRKSPVLFNPWTLVMGQTVKGMTARAVGQLGWK